MKHFINILDHSADELDHILLLASELKARHHAGIPDRPLQGKILGMYFEKPSLRTRVSLEAAMSGMGGSAIYLATNGAPLGTRETLADQARVMSRYVHAITIRTFAHSVVETFAAWSSVPVINALSDHSHPTQAMADMLTLREHLGELRGRTLAFLGDGNNVARSLAAVAARLGLRFVVAGPPGYELDEAFLAKVRAAEPAADIRLTHDATDAVREASAIYTDVWASMGQEDEFAQRQAIFQPYQINRALVEQAPADAIVLHCLPAHRGEEITDEVIDSSASVVFDQAENRMHINRALLTLLLEERS